MSKPFYIKIDKEEDLEWLKNLITNSLNADPNSRILLRYYDQVKNWHDALNNPLSATEFAEQTGIPKPTRTRTTTKKKKKQTKREQKLDERNPDICTVHPTYGAVRRPRTDCDSCWLAYKRRHPMDYPAVRRDFERKMLDK